MKPNYKRSDSISFLRKTRRGAIVNHNVELYLRNDIENGIGKVLDSSADFFIVPTTDIILSNMEVLENPKVINLIIFTTVLRVVQRENRNVYRRLLSVLKKKEKRFFLFANEYHQECYVRQLPGEKEKKRNRRCVCKTIEYYDRVASETPIFLLVKNPSDWKEESIPSSTKVDTLRRFLESHIPDLVKLIPPIKETIDNLVAPPPPRKSKVKEAIFDYHLSSEKIRELQLKNEPIYQGTIRTSRYNPFRGKIEMGGNHIYPLVQISGKRNMNRCINGDLVVFQVLPKAFWDDPSGLPCAKVLSIRHRKKIVFCGSIREGSSKHSSRVLFEPVYRKYPFIVINTRQTRELMNMRIRVQIDEWPVTSSYPKGHYVGMIGPAGTLDTETKVLLEEHDVPHLPFPPVVLSCLPSLENFESIVRAELEGGQERRRRRDLREELVMSIDPPGCTDIDDALHVKILDKESEKYEIGVHIADVSFFLREGTAIDAAARERSTSVYLVQKRISMLPRLLTDNLCSIHQGVERLTFSVIWTVDGKTGRVEGTWFGRTVVKSSCALTYSQAQKIIDDSNQQDQRAKSLRILQKISLILRSRRFEAGALSLFSPAVKFGLGSDRVTPTDMAMYETGESHHLVEEFMLLANISVAERLVKYYPDCALLRKHPSPLREKFIELNKHLERTVGKTLDLGHGSLGLSNSLAELSRISPDVIQKYPEIDMLVRTLTTRCMQQALYFPSGSGSSMEEKGHYGLAVPLYTHFTSPIRRYADVIVHRQLATTIPEENQGVTKEMFDRKKIEEICSVMNERGRMAQIAGRESVGLYTQFFFRGKSIKNEKCNVVRLSEGGISVFFPNFGFEEYLSGSNYDGVYDHHQGVYSMIDPISGERREFRIFDTIYVNFTAKRVSNFKCKMVVELLKEGEEIRKLRRQRKEEEEEEEDDKVTGEKRKRNEVVDLEDSECENDEKVTKKRKLD